MLRHSTRTIGRLEEAVASVLLYDRLEDQSDALGLISLMDGSCSGSVRDFALRFAFAMSPSWLEESNAADSSWL